MEKFTSLIEEFLDANTIEKGNSKNTRNAYKNDLSQFNYWLKSKHVSYSQITENQIETTSDFLLKEPGPCSPCGGDQHDGAVR